MKTYYGLIGAGGHGREFMPMLRASLAQELAQGDVETLFVVEGQQAEGQVNGHRLLGLDAFLARADELADAYGERFRPTPYLRDLAAKGEFFPA